LKFKNAFESSNLHHLVGPGSDAEEREVIIITVSSPLSHAVLSSKQIHIPGPLPASHGGNPIREYRVGSYWQPTRILSQVHRKSTKSVLDYLLRPLW
ncbi:hypothetical protein ACO22_06438, partial [Paracoccidioides brasiliensis]